MAYIKPIVIRPMSVLTDNNFISAHPSHTFSSMALSLALATGLRSEIFFYKNCEFRVNKNCGKEYAKFKVSSCGSNAAACCYHTHPPLYHRIIWICFRRRDILLEIFLRSRCGIYRKRLSMPKRKTKNKFSLLHPLSIRIRRRCYDL